MQRILTYQREEQGGSGGCSRHILLRGFDKQNGIVGWPLAGVEGKQGGVQGSRPDSFLQSSMDLRVNKAFTSMGSG